MRFANPEFKALFGNPPQSGDDIKLLPLQAADLLAWRLRKLEEDSYRADSIANTMLPLKIRVETSR
jgi:hypothetical protein